MKLDTPNLRHILSSVNPGLAKKMIIDIMTHYIFTGEFLATYSGMICIHHPCKTDFRCSVKASDLFDIISHVKVDKVDIELKDNLLKINDGLHIEAELTADLERKGEAEITEIKRDLKRNKDGWQVLPEDFMEALNLCMFAASKDETQARMTYIKVEGTSVLSCDGKRISWYELSSPVSHSSNNLFFIKASVIPELKKFDVKDILITDSYIHFRTEDGVVFSSVIMLSGDIPDVKQHIENMEGEKVKIPEEALEALRTGSLMAETDQFGTRTVFVTIENNQMTFKSRKETGKIIKTIEINYNKDPISFAIDPTFLEQIISSKVKVMILGKQAACFRTGKFRHAIAFQHGKG